MIQQSWIDNLIINSKRVLEAYVSTLNYGLEEICMDEVINHPKFATQFGSAGKHHAFPGGLLVHTSEVVTYAAEMAKMFEGVCDEDVLITAAVFHDLMKINEYELVQDSSPGHLVTDVYGRLSTHIGKTEYRNLVRHVAGSHAEFMKAIVDHDIPDGVVLGIEHAILAHHGRQEYGSPTEPKTVEARILHYADMFSAEHGPASKVDYRQVLPVRVN